MVYLGRLSLPNGRGKEFGMRNYRVAIVGGGFSGLVSAIILSERFGGKNVALLEKNDRVGKKILATGNGRGNITNLEITADNYHSQNGFDVKNAIEKYGNKSIIDFFYKLGIPVTTDGNRVYPASLQASSILDAMREKLDYLKTEIFTEAECREIKSDGGAFVLKTDGFDCRAQNVIFAVGGKCGKQYGTDGSAFGVIEKLGVKITDLHPAIVQLKTETDKIRGLKGLKEKAVVSAYDGDKFLKSFYGDVLFTDFGISGNAAFYLSSYLVGVKSPSAVISFTEKSQEELADFLIEKVKNLPYVTLENLLNGVMNKQVGRAVVKSSGVKDTGENSLKKIAATAKKFTLKVTGTLGFDYAQVTRGGVPFSAVDDCFELKNARGLFVVGEALDADGDCGGYNLQWAYSSARVATDKITAKQNR